MGLHGKTTDPATSPLSSSVPAVNKGAGLKVLWVEWELFKLILLAKKSVESQTNPEGCAYCHWISVKDHMGLSLVNVRTGLRNTSLIWQRETSVLEKQRACIWPRTLTFQPINI